MKTKNSSNSRGEQARDSHGRFTSESNSKRGSHSSTTSSEHRGRPAGSKNK